MWWNPLYWIMRWLRRGAGDDGQFEPTWSWVTFGVLVPLGIVCLIAWQLVTFRVTLPIRGRWERTWETVDDPLIVIAVVLAELGVASCLVGRSAFTHLFRQRYTYVWPIVIGLCLIGLAFACVLASIVRSLTA